MKVDSKSMDVYTVPQNALNHASTIDTDKSIFKCNNIGNDYDINISKDKNITANKNKDVTHYFGNLGKQLVKWGAVGAACMAILCGFNPIGIVAGALGGALVAGLPLGLGGYGL